MPLMQQMNYSTLS